MHNNRTTFARTSRNRQVEKSLNIANTRQASSLIKMLGKKFVPRVNVLRNQESTLLQPKDEIELRWTQYYSSLYEDHRGGEGMVRELQEIAPLTSDNSHDILCSEVQDAIHTLKINKSPGSDAITVEILQAGGEQLVRQMHKLGNKAWDVGTIPEEWGESILAPIPKKGDLTNGSNYRTISLINHSGKAQLTLLLNILKIHLDPCLVEEQAGFREDRSNTLPKSIRHDQTSNHMGYAKIMRCRNKDDHPNTEDLQKSTVNCSYRKRYWRVVWNISRN